MFIADSPSWHQSSFYNLKSGATIGQKAQQLAEQRETVGLSEGGRPSKTGLSKDPVSPSAQGVGHGTDQAQAFFLGQLPGPPQQRLVSGSRSDGTGWRNAGEVGGGWTQDRG